MRRYLQQYTADARLGADCKVRILAFRARVAGLHPDKQRQGHARPAKDGTHLQHVEAAFEKVKAYLCPRQADGMTEFHIVIFCKWNVLQVRRSLTRRVSPAPSDKTSSGRMSLGTSRRPFRRSSKQGAGHYWAFAQRRSDRRQSVSLGDWFLHVLRGRDGRALKHPCFYYFAERVIS